ncbi:MAG: M48 family metalloprotease, partial [Candidatus Hydrogenedentales bacterium]
TMCAVLLGSIVMLAEVLLRSRRFSGGRLAARLDGGDGGGGAGGVAVLVILAIALLLAVLGPLLARLIYLAVSRRREYLADASAAVYTRFPEGLASALEKLGRSIVPLERATKATAPMYIVNPFVSADLDSWSSTHPPLRERVRILRGIGGTVSYGAYQEAWNQVGHRKQDHIPKSALAAAGASVRAPHPEAKSQRDRMREAGDLLRKVNQFVFLPCPCGMQIKLPPDYKNKTVNCPRCQRDLAVPVAEFAALEAVADQLAPKETRLFGKKPSAPKTDEVVVVKRRGKVWQSFKCACGATKTLSPNFSAPQTRCDSCGRRIVVESG